MCIQKKISLDSGTIEVRNNKYVEITFFDFNEITLEEVLKREEAILEVCNGKPMPFLIETRSTFINYSEEAREYMANKSKLTPVRLAEAFIVNNLGVKILIQNYLKKNPEKCPAEVFKDKEVAVNWMDQFIES